MVENDPKELKYFSSKKFSMPVTNPAQRIAITAMEQLNIATNIESYI